MQPSFFEHLEDRLNLAVFDINEEWRMKLRLKEPAMVDGVLRPAGYVFDNGALTSPGPGPWEVDNSAAPFPLLAQPRVAI